MHRAFDEFGSPVALESSQLTIDAYVAVTHFMATNAFEKMLFIHAGKRSHLSMAQLTHSHNSIGNCQNNLGDSFVTSPDTSLTLMSAPTMAPLVRAVHIVVDLSIKWLDAKREQIHPHCF